MGRKKTSPIWTKITKNELQNLLDKSNSLVEVIKSFGLDPYNGNHKTLKQRIKEENLSLSKLEQNRKLAQTAHLSDLKIKKRISDENVFCVGSSYNRHYLKQRLVKLNLLEYKCLICGCGDAWNGQPISLQLDHINGVNNDNRLENLRFLCPNCHSQTKTFSGKRLRKFCCKCNTRKVKTKCGKFCDICFIQNRNQTLHRLRKFNPSKTDLELVLIRFKRNFSAVGRYYNVSDNAVRKRCKLLEI